MTLFTVCFLPQRNHLPFRRVAVGSARCCLFGTVEEREIKKKKTPLVLINIQPFFFSPGRGLKRNENEKYLKVEHFYAAKQRIHSSPYCRRG